MKHLTDIQKIEAAELLHAEENPHAEHLGLCRSCYEEVLSMSIADHHNENPGKQPPATFSEQFGESSSGSPKASPAGWAKWAGAAAAIAVVASGLYLALLPGQSNQVKTAAFITFVKGQVAVNGQTADTGMRLVKGDTITTGKASVAAVQFNNQAVATLEPKTEITIGKFQLDGNRPDITVKQRRGKAFHKIRKNSAEYKVETLTLVAAVRGTMFEITAGQEGTTVSMHEGVVAAKSQNNGLVDAANEQTVSKSQKLIHGPEKNGQAEFKVRKLKRAEKQRLKALSKIAIVELNLDELASPQAESNKLEPVIVQKLSNQSVVDSIAQAQILGSKTGKKATTLADLKKEYGQLSRIILKNGKEYIGAFKMQKNMLRITTVNGSFKVPGEAVLKIVPHEL